jgi:hypothetical protein
VKTLAGLFYLSQPQRWCFPVVPGQPSTPAGRCVTQADAARRKSTTHFVCACDCPCATVGPRDTFLAELWQHSPRDVKRQVLFVVCAHIPIRFHRGFYFVFETCLDFVELSYLSLCEVCCRRWQRVIRLLPRGEGAKHITKRLVHMSYRSNAGIPECIIPAGP